MRLFVAPPVIRDILAILAEIAAVVVIVASIAIIAIGFAPV